MAIIGREGPADIVVPYPQVSSRHALIESAGPGAFRVVDLGSANGIFVSGQRVTDAEVGVGCDLRLGSIPFPWNAHRDALAAEERETGGWVIGREAPADVVIPDSRLSARHVRVLRQGPGLLIKDLGSTNGTFVNGRAVARAIVTPGDVLSLGTLGIDAFQLLKDREPSSRALDSVAAGPPSRQMGFAHAKPVPGVARSVRTPLSSIAKRRLAIACVAAAVAVGLGGWYYTALQAFDAHVRELRAAMDQLEVKRVGWLADPGEAPAGGLDAQKVAAYVADVRTQAPKISAVVNRLKTGEGTSFWLPGRRQELADSALARLAAEEQAANEAEGALAAVSQPAGTTAAALSVANAEFDKAGQAFSPVSDLDDFAAAARKVEANATMSEKTRMPIVQMIATAHDAGRPDRIRSGLLQGFSEALSASATRARSRGAALKQATQTLDGYKGRMVQTLGGSANLIGLLNRVATLVGPGVRTAYEYSQPVMAALKQAEQPLAMGGELGSRLQSFLGGSGGGSLSPLGALRAVSPEADAAVEVIEGACTAIERLNHETQEISARTGKLVPAMSAFSSERRRGSMLEVVREAPGAAEYLNSRSGVFDPAIAKLEGVRDQVRAFESFVARVPTFFQDALGRVAAGAHYLLNSAEEPFKAAKAIMIRSAEQLSHIRDMEGEYEQRLRLLSGAGQ